MTKRYKPEKYKGKWKVGQIIEFNLGGKTDTRAKLVECRLVGEAVWRVLVQHLYCAPHTIMLPDSDILCIAKEQLPDITADCPTCGRYWADE